MHEYILVLQKGAKGNAEKNGEKIPLNRIVKREIANSIWNIPPVPPGMVNHPVPFPEQIPWRLITLLTKKGDMVLDPMNGSGQTTKTAFGMGRKYLGFDTRMEYVKEARSRLKQEPRLSDYLIPVFYKESWSKDIQGGFFETAEVDLSPNIPKEYKFLFRTDRRQGLYAYYGNSENRYICHIIGAGGKQYRLNLGGTDEEGSMLHDMTAGLPAEQFVKSDLKGILKTSIVKKNHPENACIDMLLHLGCIRHDGAENGLYEMAPKGRRLQKNLPISQQTELD